MSMNHSPLPTGASKTFKRQVEAFRALVHQEVHPVQMMVFLEVCNTPPLSVSVTYIKDELHISQAAASRHCRMMVDKYSPSKEGHGLCRWVQDPKDFRSKYLELTEKGEAVREELRKVFTK